MASEEDAPPSLRVSDAASRRVTCLVTLSYTCLHSNGVQCVTSTLYPKMGRPFARGASHAMCMWLMVLPSVRALGGGWGGAAATPRARKHTNTQTQTHKHKHKHTNTNTALQRGKNKEHIPWRACAGGGGGLQLLTFGSHQRPLPPTAPPNHGVCTDPHPERGVRL